MRSTDINNSSNSYLDDFYLGVIFPTPKYFINPLGRKRLIQYPEADPFYELEKEQALALGQVVLLKKNGDKYSDCEYSIFENELTYRLGVPNRLGIILADVKPFSDYFDDSYIVISHESTCLDEDLLEFAYRQPYYVVYYKTSGNFNIVINELHTMDDVRYDFFYELLGEEDFSKIVLHQNPQKRK